MAWGTIGRILLAICCAAPLSAAAQSLSKRGPDPKPAPGPPSLEEVFVTKAPRKGPRKANEVATVKEAFAKVKNGGVIFITEDISDISNDGSGLFIDRPVTIALDPGLITKKAKLRDNDLPRAFLNAAADGTCITVGQYELGSLVGRRKPLNEVTIRGVEFVPNPASTPRTCVELNAGKLFLDNVAIAAERQPFMIGVAVNGGELITNQNFFVDAGLTGISISGGAAEIADGADIRYVGPRPAEVTLDQPCDSLIDEEIPVGIWAGDSGDARVGDPLAILRGVDIEGFAVGICAEGAGVSAESANIQSTSIGIRAEERIRVSGSRIREAKVAALIALSKDAEFIKNKFYNSGIGVFLEEAPLPTFRENQFLFNATGIRYNANGKSYDDEILTEQSFIRILLQGRSERDKRLVGSFTDNVIACNSAPGAFEKFRLFRKAHRNECRYNTLNECSVARVSHCRGPRQQFFTKNCHLEKKGKRSKECIELSRELRRHGCSGETQSKVCDAYRRELNLPPPACAAER